MDHPGATAGDDGGGAQVLLDVGGAHAAGGHKAMAMFCYCDLDHLKYINDTYGHEEGDWYLNHFVDIVQEQIRKKDLFARIGGDEFCIAIEECDKAYLRERMQMIQEAFRTRVERPYLKDFSFGIIDSFEFPVKASVHELIQEADKRMYSQKEEHQYRIFYIFSIY